MKLGEVIVPRVPRTNTILQFPLTRMVLAVLFVGLGGAAAQISLQFLRSAMSLTDSVVINLLAFLLFVPATYAAYRTYVHLVEQRPATEVSPMGAVGEVSRGALLGIVLFTCVILSLGLLGYYHVTGVNGWSPLLGAFAGASASAFAQELIFRCSIFRITEEVMGSWWALAISAVLFGAIHSISPAATIVSTTGVVLEAGILLGAAYMLTRRIWFVVGVHAAWDFANDGVFGVAVSGTSGRSLPGLLRARLDGPSLLTGGAFGVEASLLAVIGLLAVGAYLVWRANGQDTLLRPMWHH